MSPSDTRARETPIRRQWERLRAQHPTCLLLFQLGDFFESFETDAEVVARVCGVTLTSRELGKGDRVALAGVPVARLEPHLAKLVDAGLRVAVAEQVTPPGSGLVQREVTRVVTPGTLAEPGLLREKEHTYLAAVSRGRARSGEPVFGLSYADVSTGDFACAQIAGADAEEQLRAELERLAPAELLVPEAGDLPAGGGLDGLPRSGHLTPCQAWRFDPSSARERLRSRLGVLSLEGFGCEHLPLALGAAGAIVSYLEETSPRLLPSLAGLRTYEADARSGMALDGFTRRNLEVLRSGRGERLAGSLLGVLDRTRTPMGGRLLRAWLSQPLLDLARIEARLDGVEALARQDALRGRARALLGQVGDIERVTARIAQGTATARELLALADSLGAAAAIGQALDTLARREPAPRESEPRAAPLPVLEPCPDVVEMIARAVAPLDSGRAIRPGYSPELDTLVASIGASRRWLVDLEQTERARTGIRSLKVGFNRVFGYYVEVTRANLSLVPPDYQRKQTLTGVERFVTPPLKACEARITAADERIHALEGEVFGDLLRDLSRHAPRLRRLAARLARLDVLAALADVARERGYCRPTVDHGDTVRVVGGRHPVVEASLEPGAFIPNDCQLSTGDGLSTDGCQVALITGPNMAGKSTYLRQVALIVLLAQAGSFVPADEAHIGVVDRIFTRVGAQDDLAAGASTFMVEMTEAASILRHATPRSLVVLDEIGRGTSTYDGLSIARAVVEELHARVGARTLFATHFHELAALADELPRVRVFNAAVSDEGGEVVFLRRVVPGAAARSYGIHVARLAGLPRSVTERAQVILRGLESAGPVLRQAQDERSTVVAAAAVPSEIPAPPEALARASSNGATLQPALDGFTPGPDLAQRLLDEVRELDVTQLTPMQALNALWDLQRRAGRG